MRLASIALLVCSLALAGAEAARLHSAHARAESGLSRLDTARRLAQRVVDLRAGSDRIVVGRRPEQDATERVLAAMDAAGVPRAAFRSLAPDADTPLARTSDSGPIYRRQSFRLTLEPIDAAKLGALLAAWRGNQRVWTVERIELDHAASGRQSDADAYTARLTIAATYIATPTKQDHTP